MRSDQKEQIKRLALLLHERDLSRFRVATAQKAKTEQDLLGLDKTSALADRDPNVCREVVDRYNAWAMNRRILLNQQLADDLLRWNSARQEAQRSLGRAEVLKMLGRRR